MNYYLLAFIVYAALIAPVSLRFSLRLGKRAGFGVRFQVSGLPPMRKRKSDDIEGERPIREREFTRAVAATDAAFIKAVVLSVFRRRTFAFVELRSLSLHVRFSFDDACSTALWYSAARELWRTLMLCLTPRSKLEGHFEADFGGSGTEVLLRGIIGARLGSISRAALILGALYLSKRAAKQAEEGDHAAASD